MIHDIGCYYGTGRSFNRPPFALLHLSNKVVEIIHGNQLMLLGGRGRGMKFPWANEDDILASHFCSLDFRFRPFERAQMLVSYSVV